MVVRSTICIEISLFIHGISETQGENTYFPMHYKLDLQLTETELDPIHGICYPKYGKPRPIIVMHGAKLEANYL